MIRFLTVAVLAAVLPAAWAQDPSSAGRTVFENRCSGCHGADGNGGELGPPIAIRVPNLTDEHIAGVVRNGLPTRGMPANEVSATDMPQLLAFLRKLVPRETGFRPYSLKAALANGKTLEGTVVNEALEDLQMRGADGRIHLLRHAPGGKYREVTSDVNWPFYNGGLSGNRYTTLSQVTKLNVKKLAPKWVFTMPGAFGLQGTPVVVDGVMYVTNANECYALDAGSGRVIWHFKRARTRGLIGNAAGGNNRGVAVAGDRAYMVTDNAHLLALNRWTGEIDWETEMADSRQNYNATSAPLVVNDLVVVGTAGGEEGVRGFLSAYAVSTGKRAWQFWTVPAAGEPGSETWQGNGIAHGGASTWFTGSYDPDTDTIFWQAGNPGPDYNGAERKGDNLYSDSILALDAKTGKLKWYYQTTPHDLWDWDTTETVVLLNTNWQGQPRKLLVQGNRNGFFYVFDRTDGKLLLAKKFINEMTWATGIDAKGRPQFVAGQEPSTAGTRVCPSQDGATNWYSPSFSPATGLFYMQTNEKCSVYSLRPVEWKAGQPFLGGAEKTDAGTKPHRILRAIDLQTGAVKWELPQKGEANSWGGTIATSTGLVFFGDESGAFAAADAVTGKLLWSFQTSQNWKASPMAYQFDGKQYFAVAASGNVIAFGLVE
ncbi:MAG: Pyrrolo-quinoline quinone [Bryobacterales bacterium]|nr:Pyrrolo-quinoline quinone [Bryobacterales bacterium]